ATLPVDPGIEPSGGPPGTATWHQVTPEELRIHVNGTSDSLVVIRNSFGAGWTSSVDGQPARLLGADYLLQAVPVPAGTHDVELVYRDPRIGQGLAASGLVWLAWAVALGAVAAGTVRRRRRPARDGPRPG